MKATARYTLVYSAGHPRATSNGQVREHFLIVERAMGRLLPADAEVHHVDGNGRNNANANLVVCQDHAYHMLLHQRQRAFDACGDANALRCGYCFGYDRQQTMVRYKSRFGNDRGAHRDCVKAHNARRKRIGGGVRIHLPKGLQQFKDGARIVAVDREMVPLDPSVERVAAQETSSS
jgi:hypothetical protein